MIRGRFILTGVIFYFITAVVSVFFFSVALFLSLISKWVIKKILRFFTKKEILKESVKEEIIKSIKDFFDLGVPGNVVVIFGLFLTWFFIYSVYFFPYVPAVFGGGQPRAISLVVTSDTMPVLTSLGIKKGEGAQNQTENLCIVHENEKSIVVVRDDRVLLLNKTLFEGFGSLPGTRSVYEQDCIFAAAQWTSKGFFFARVLLWVEIQNAVLTPIASILGFPLSYRYFLELSPVINSN